MADLWRIRRSYRFILLLYFPLPWSVEPYENTTVIPSKYRDFSVWCPGQCCGIILKVVMIGPWFRPAIASSVHRGFQFDERRSEIVWNKGFLSVILEETRPKLSSMFLRCRHSALIYILLTLQHSYEPKELQLKKLSKNEVDDLFYPQRKFFTVTIYGMTTIWSQFSSIGALQFAQSFASW